MFWRGFDRNYGSTGVFEDMRRLSNEMNRLFAAAPSRWDADYPACNLWVDDDHVVLDAELPGMSAEDIELDIVGNTLTLKGERKSEEIEGASCYRRERGIGKFSRTMELPFRIDAEKVEAKFSKGVLVVNLPRAEADKPKKITLSCD